MAENNEKKYFKVAITETLRRVVTVAAKDADDAHQKVSDRWHNGEYVLVTEDFDGVEFYVTGEGTAEEAEKEKKARDAMAFHPDREVDTDA